VSADRPVIEEIMVTAQRREERLSEVPITINVLTGEALNNASVDRTDEALQLVPGLSFETFGTTAQSNIFIRGIGTSLLDGGVETSVAMYADDVYYGAQQAFNASLFDTDRIEVLRGPQGSLYGKNALGGAVKIYSKQPEDRFKAEIEGAFGNYGYKQGRGVLNAPLADGLLLTRFTATYEQRDAFFKNQFPGAHDFASIDESEGFRAQVALRPTNGWSVSLSADWGHLLSVDDRGELNTPDTRTVNDALAIAMYGEYPPM
jgi:iron complex outermembrane receptor protein